MNKISVIVCTKNSERNIAQVLKSIRDHGDCELIVVDAYSHDHTVEIAEYFSAKIIYDKGIGLGNARNIGLSEASGNYIFYVGSDNVFPGHEYLYSNLYEKLIKEMKENKWSGIALGTMIQNPQTYLQNAMNTRYQNRIGWGEKKVIGTPFLFPTKLLRKYKFSSLASWSDDTELCNRLRKDGHKVGYSKTFICYELPYSLKELMIRFKLYGRSDREYFNTHYKNWGLLRRIKSILHPFDELKTITNYRELKYLPFILLMILCRYIGYIKG